MRRLALSARLYGPRMGLLALALAGAGCPASAKLRFNAAETYGKVYYLDGVGCYGIGSESIPEGLRLGGFRGDVEYWSWSATGTPFDQWGGPLIPAKAKELARLIVRYRATYPGRPLSLVGLSSGTGVAVFACEQLPEGVWVDEVTLVASSLSQEYDLSKALRHIRGDITLFQTEGDLILALGARLMGTIDGKPLATSAGLVGFKPPDGLGPEDRALYSRVRNIPYQPAFVALGFDGSHISAVTSPAFICQKMAPLVLAHACAPGTAGRPPGPLPPGFVPAASQRRREIATTRPVD